jgi:DNA-binding response OmpR family regulator
MDSYQRVQIGVCNVAMARIVCVADDEGALRRLHCLQLERAGFVTVQATSGLMGLKAVQRTGAAVAVIDVVMPDQQGFAMIHELKELCPKTRILAISRGGASGRVNYLKLARERGADAVMAKPFGRMDLVECVKRLGCG